MSPGPVRKSMRNRCVSGSRGAFLLGAGVTAAFIITACGGSAASTADLSGRTGAAAGRGGQRPAVIVERTTAVEHIAVHRQVDLSGTLMSPEQAKVSSEVAGPVRE